jgi:hypothetical protein
VRGRHSTRANVNGCEISAFSCILEHSVRQYAPALRPGCRGRLLAQPALARWPATVPGCAPTRIRVALQLPRAAPPRPLLYGDSADPVPLR